MDKRDQMSEPTKEDIKIRLGLFFGDSQMFTKEQVDNSYRWTTKQIYDALMRLIEISVAAKGVK